MVGNQRRHALSLFSSLTIATMSVGFTQPLVSYAVDPDIPRIQSSAEGGSIPREIELGAAYLSGRGVARDEETGRLLVRKSRKLGRPSRPGADWLFLPSGHWSGAGSRTRRSVVRARCGRRTD